MSEEPFDFVRMSATGRHLQETVLARMAERGAKLDHRETEAIMLLCAELASITYSDDRRAQWGAIAYLAHKMRDFAR